MITRSPQLNNRHVRWFECRWAVPLTPRFVFLPRPRNFLSASEIFLRFGNENISSICKGWFQVVPEVEIMFWTFLCFRQRSQDPSKRRNEGTDFCQIKKHVILPRVNQKFITAMKRNSSFFCSSNDEKKVKKNLSDLSDLYLEKMMAKREEVEEDLGSDGRRFWWKQKTLKRYIQFEGISRNFKI